MPSASALPSPVDRTDESRPLTLQRSASGAWSSADDAAALGGLRYSEHADDQATGALHGVPAQRLLGSGDWIDAWHSAGVLTSGGTQGVHWRHNGCWLHGAIDLPERPGEGLEALSHQAYAALFAALRETGFLQLQRIWNYLPHINAEVAGMERYRQFNVGRQRAFIDDGRDVQAGLPAACALGTQEDRLRIRFLAAHTAAVPIENPRQVSAYRYPTTYGPRAPSFSRAALVDAGGGRIALLISGTASIVDHASVHPGDVQAQTRETLANLQAVIAAAHRRSTARFTLADLDCTVYVRRPADAAAIREVLADAVGAQRAASALYLQADICRSELLVEIEAHVFAAGSLLA